MNIDETEAPAGYRACAPQPHDAECASCAGCDLFHVHDRVKVGASCHDTHLCMAGDRSDGHDVIMKLIETKTKEQNI